MIRANKLKLYIRAMQTQGFSAAQTLDGARIDSAKLRDPDYLIELWQEQRIIANIMRLTQQPVALTLIDDLDIADLGILGPTLTTCETLSQAAGLWKTYSPLLLGQMLCSDLQRARNELHVVFTEMVPLGPLLSFCVEESLMFGKFIGENMLKMPFVFSRLSLTYAPPRHHRAYTELFKCPVDFNTKINRITITTPVTIEHASQPDAELHEICLKQCEKVLEKISTDQPWASRVRTQLLRKNVMPSLDEVASALHISGRSLRRHLYDEGKNFQQILNEHRFDMARDYLGATKLSNQEIGFLLGYRDVKAFFRAFKEWAGCTVNDYRETCAHQTHPQKFPASHKVDAGNRHQNANFTLAP
jgi:AraC-like DNA-binding protein